MRTKDLVEKAEDLMDIGKYEDAADIASELIELEEEEGFEIMTSVLEDQEKLDQALEVLEHGLSVFPDSWRLWLRMGSYKSDLNSYDEAAYAFSRAELLPDADLELVILNQAILLKKQEQYKEALSLLEQVNEVFPIRSLVVELGVYNSLKDYELIITIVEQTDFDLEIHTENHENDDGEFDPLIAEIYFFYAHAIWKKELSEKTSEALTYGLEFDRTNDNLLWLRREILGVITDQNRYFSLMVQGDWFEVNTEENLKFVSYYDVVASTPEEALTMIKDFEPFPFNTDSFIIEEFEEMDNHPENPNGIYRTNKFFLFEEEPEA